MKILLVDDEKKFAMMLSKRLALRGIEVDYVFTGAEAVAKVENNKYDVAILDVKMPGIGGIELERKLKALVPGMKRIFLTGHGSDPFSKALVNKADVILVMEQWQKELLIERFPEAECKTFRMMEYLWNGEPDEIRDIPDPTGQNLTDYEEFMEVAHSEVERIFRELCREGVI